MGGAHSKKRSPWRDLHGSQRVTFIGIGEMDQERNEQGEKKEVSFGGDVAKPIQGGREPTKAVRCSRLQQRYIHSQREPPAGHRESRGKHLHL